MKTLSYSKAHALSDFSIEVQDIVIPEPAAHDILVRLKAISINPVDYKIRSTQSATSGNSVILGWDAAGVVDKVGSQVQDFKVGDEVFYAGDLTRNGSYSEFQTVDSRIVAKKPKSLNFTDSAALPLTSLTAWEALLERGFKFSPKAKVLVIGGAGGVGSIAIQLLKAETNATVIATASRPDTISWVKKMGADHIIDHSKGLKEELARLDLREVDIIFGTTHSDKYVKVIPEILRPFGHFILIDDPGALDVGDFKLKSQSIHWELMFTKTLYRHELASQGSILRRVAELVDSGKVKTTRNLILQGLSTKNIREAHTLLESGKSVGKIVINLEA